MHAHTFYLQNTRPHAKGSYSLPFGKLRMYGSMVLFFFLWVVFSTCGVKTTHKEQVICARPRPMVNGYATKTAITVKRRSNTMCYDDNARPPVPKGIAGAAHGEDLVLEAADGNRF